MRGHALRRCGRRAVTRARLTALVGAALALVAACAARAIDTEQAFDDAALDERYHELIHEVRCLVCQNQTIADSNAPLAADLRREIHDMIAAGKTDDDIVEFIVARYGAFALYRPPLQPSTWALWGAPVVFLIVGGFAFARVVRTRAARDADGEVE